MRNGATPRRRALLWHGRFRLRHESGGLCLALGQRRRRGGGEGLNHGGGGDGHGSGEGEGEGEGRGGSGSRGGGVTARLVPVHGVRMLPLEERHELEVSFTSTESGLVQLQVDEAGDARQSPMPICSPSIPRSHRIARTVPGRRSRLPQFGIVVRIRVDRRIQISWLPRVLRSNSQSRRRSLRVSSRYVKRRP